jgi:hypothetical protein
LKALDSLKRSASVPGKLVRPIINWTDWFQKRDRVAAALPGAAPGALTPARIVNGHLVDAYSERRPVMQSSGYAATAENIP